MLVDDAPKRPFSPTTTTAAEEGGDAKRRLVMAVTLDEPLDYHVLEDMDADEIGVPDGLTLEAARAGKREALEMLEHYGVFEAKPIDELDGIKRLRARWEPQRRGDEIKWRYVAQEFKWMEERDDCFAAASTATTSKIVDFIGLKTSDAVTFAADCIKA